MPGTTATAPANVFYAQSGGVTAVINASACGVIETARAQPQRIGHVFAGRNGILGALREELIDTSHASDAAVAALRSAPGGAFGSCRYKLANPDEDDREYARLLDVFRAHNIGYFFYNGGGDSQDTAHKVAMLGARRGYPIVCLGIPKTVDNDLKHTDACPGFGSVAKYVATAVREAALDVASMCETSTRVFILEVMGRHAGWIAAAAGLAAKRRGDAPHLILFPEMPFDEADFLRRVRDTVQRAGYCVVVASEGARDASGTFLAESGRRDAFGHAQLGGVAPRLAALVQRELGYKHHWAVADYLQRSARHIASATDLKQAYAVGAAAVELALAGRNAVMPVIVRECDQPYRWRIGSVPLARVANAERKLPRAFVSSTGYGITAAARRYLAPLIAGEDAPPFRDGLPDYAEFPRVMAPKRLPAFSFEGA